MYGFKPQHARGKPVQNFADGGIVHSLTGMLGMRKRTPEEMLASDAKTQARNQEAAARVAARNQAAQESAPPPEKAITSYTGMSAMQRREQAAGLKDGGTVGGFKPGGLIRGPGTGTSDSIKTEKRPGTFIMPADSTKAIGPEALERLGESEEMEVDDEREMDDDAEEGEESVPVRLSNGEFELPPEQVQALGEAVLTVLRDATHTPAEGGKPTAKGFAPNQFFANGGAVFGSRGLAGLREMIPKVQAMGYPQAQQAPQAPAGTRDAAALKAMIPKMEAMGYPQALADGGTVGDEEKQRLANQSAMYVLGAQTAAANRPQEPATAPATAPAPAAATQSEYGRQMSAVGGALVDGAAWLGKTIVSAPGYGFNKPSAAPAPAGAATANAGAGRGAINPAPVSPTQPVATAPAPTNAPTNAPAAPTQPPTNEVMPGVYRHGRGQYSDNAAGMAIPPGFTGQPNAQNMAAADALVARQTPAGFQPAGSQPAGVQAPVVRNSTNDWAARKALANAETAASSITNTRRWGGKGAENSPDVQAYQAMLKNDLALQQAQPGMDQTAMRENAGIQREGMQQAGATARTGMQEQGSNARDARRNALTAEELGLRREAQGFQTRAAAQQEQLRNVLLDPKSTPEQRAVAQRNLAALSGKTAADRMQTVALPDTTNEMGQVVRGGQALVRVLEDGTVQQVPIGTQAPAPIAAPKAGEVRNGYRFKGGNPNDQANWTKV